MPTIWSGSAPVTGCIKTIGGTKSATFSCQSCTSVDVDNYDEDIYRDTFAEAIGSIRGDFTTSERPLTKLTEAGIGTMMSSPAGFAIDDITLDDRAAHTPPKPTTKKRTLFLFWTGSGGVGDVVAACWADEFMGFAPEFSYI